MSKQDEVKDRERQWSNNKALLMQAQHAIDIWNVDLPAVESVLTQVDTWQSPDYGKWARARIALKRCRHARGDFEAPPGVAFLMSTPERTGRIGYVQLHEEHKDNDRNVGASMIEACGALIAKLEKLYQESADLTPVIHLDRPAEGGSLALSTLIAWLFQKLPFLEARWKTRPKDFVATGAWDDDHDQLAPVDGAEIAEKLEAAKRIGYRTLFLVEGQLSEPTRQRNLAIVQVPPSLRDAIPVILDELLRAVALVEKDKELLRKFCATTRVREPHTDSPYVSWFATCIGAVSMLIPKPLHMCLLLSFLALIAGTVNVLSPSGTGQLRAGDVNFQRICTAIKDGESGEAGKFFWAVVGRLDSMSEDDRPAFTRKPLMSELKEQFAAYDRDSTPSNWLQYSVLSVLNLAIADPDLKKVADRTDAIEKGRFELGPNETVHEVNRRIVDHIYSAELNGLDPLRALARVLRAWYSGFGNAKLLAFAFQMCLIILTGAALARVPFVSNAIKGFALSLVNAPTAAAPIVCVIALVSGYLSWGFSLVLCSLLVREIGLLARERRDEPIKRSFALIVAAAYMGLLVWHGGLSGSAPLLANEANALLFDLDVGSVHAGPLIENRAAELRELDGVDPKRLSIPWLSTIGSRLNLWVAALMLTVMPAAFWLISRFIASRGGMPRVDLPEPIAAQVTSEIVGQPHQRVSLVRAWAGGTVVGSVIIAAAIALFVIILDEITTDTFGQVFGLNFLIFVFLFLGLMLFRDPGRYEVALSNCAQDVGPILLQFPFYWGIFNILNMDGGLMVQRFADVSQSMVTWGHQTMGIKQDNAFVAFTYLSACVINLFVPSGGGQWFLQGPVVMEALTNLDPTQRPNAARVLLAVAYGDQTTNMIQPFWMLPILAIVKVRIAPIMAITVLFGAIASVIFLGCLLCVPMG